MAEHYEPTPGEREILAKLDEYIRSAENQPLIAPPQRWNHPIGLDDEGRKFIWDGGRFTVEESPPREEGGSPADPAGGNESADG